MNASPNHHRQRVKGSASDVVSRGRAEEDYWRGLTRDVARAYAAWEAKRKRDGDLTVSVPDQVYGYREGKPEEPLADKESTADQKDSHGEEGKSGTDE
jgi:hypothetical protein